LFELRCDALATTTTEAPASAASRAADRPATPAPTTVTSHVWRFCLTSDNLRSRVYMVDDSQTKTAAHAVLAAVLQVREGRLQALLWQRAREPFSACWALPGGALAADETLEESMRRHLEEKVDVRELSHLEQLETLSDPRRNPARRELAAGYLGLVPSGLDPEVPDDTRWHPFDELPELAYDHEEILLSARERLRAKLSYTNLGFALAPPS